MITETPSPAQLRNVAGAFPTGIAIVTISNDSSEEISGMTINSFVSVSLEPALVMFSVSNTSKLFNQLSTGLEINIHFLSVHQKNISDYFAGFDTDTPELSFKKKRNHLHIEDALAGYDLIIHEIIKAGDHHLILCNVLHCWRKEDLDPILYYKGYRTIGKLVNE